MLSIGFTYTILTRFNEFTKYCNKNINFALYFQQNVGTNQVFQISGSG